MVTTLVVRLCFTGLVASVQDATAAAAASETKQGLVFEPASRLALDLFAPAPDERPSPVVLVAGEPNDAPTPGRRDASLRALCAELAEAGIAAALCDWRAGVETGRRDLRNATEWLRKNADAEGIDGSRLALHGTGAGIQPMLELAMEDDVGAAFSMHAGVGYVIEGLRSDLPILAIVDPGASPRTRAGVRELAHQLELCSAPFTPLELAAEGAIPAITRFHRVRNDALPDDPAAIDDAERAYDVARVCAERGRAEPFHRWLDRARELGFTDVARVLHDPALVRMRALPEFRRWIADHSTAARASLCRPSEPGRRITIRARVVERDGTSAVANARVHLWQTDRSGLYAYDGGDDGRSRLFAHVRTDADGRFEIETIEPGGYPKTLIPAHIHLTVQREGRGEQSFELVFDDDPRMVDSARAYAARIGWPVVKLVDQPGGTAAGEAQVVLR